MRGAVLAAAFRAAVRGGCAALLGVLAVPPALAGAGAAAPTAPERAADLLSPERAADLPVPAPDGASTCTLPPAMHADAAALDAALDTALGQLPQCENDIAWLLGLGQRLNQVRRYAEAADLIERALLLQPALRGARVDYAVALAGSGDTASARALLASLLDEPDLPGGLRTVLMRQRSALPLALTGGWRLDAGASLRLGHDRNLLGAPDLSSLTLTLGEQLIEVLLDDSYRARAGSYRQLDAALTALHVRPGGARWTLSAAARHRASARVPDAETRQFESLAEVALPLTAGSRLAPLPPLRGYAAVAAAELRSPLSDYATRSAMAGLEGAAGPDCDLRAGAEVQQRRYRNNPLLSGTYRGLTLSAVCGGGRWAVDQGGWGLLSLRAGHDSPAVHQRPGERQRQQAWRVAYGLPWAHAGVPLPGQLFLDLEWSRQADASGYSPILDNGRPRRIQRRAVRLEWRLPTVAGPWGNLEPSLGWDGLSQKSNIALFQSTSGGPYAGLRARW